VAAHGLPRAVSVGRARRRRKPHRDPQGHPYTIAGYGLLSFAVYLLAQGMGVTLSLGHAMLFVPLVTLITVLPVSIAGWGLRESSDGRDAGA
jgi:hypothetical protein